MPPCYCAESVQVTMETKKVSSVVVLLGNVSEYIRIKYAKR
jgi:hypothetical protein